MSEKKDKNGKRRWLIAIACGLLGFIAYTAVPILSDIQFAKRCMKNSLSRTCTSPDSDFSSYTISRVTSCQKYYWYNPQYEVKPCVNTKDKTAVGKVYQAIVSNENDLISSFLGGVFSKYSWVDIYPSSARGFAWVLEIGDKYKDKDYLEGIKRGHTEKAKKYVPWAIQYMNRPQEDRPTLGVLNRWAQDTKIRVAFGWPPIEKVEHKSQGPFKSLEEISDIDVRERHLGVEIRLKDFIQQRVSELSDITKLDIEFLDGEQENTNQYANIRIVFTDDFYADNRFKRIPYPVDIGGFTHGINSYLDVAQSQFKDAVLFTPKQRSQVFGYFLTDTENNIEFSVCSIWPYHRRDMIKALVSECLIRSMGLPEMVDQADMMLGPWNQIHDTHSKLRALDEKGVNLEDKILEAFYAALDVKVQTYAQGQGGYSAEEKRALQEDLEHYGQMLKLSYFAGTDIEQKPRADITQYERALLSILYCPLLDTGMRELAVTNVLTKKIKQCLDTE